MHKVLNRKELVARIQEKTGMDESLVRFSVYCLLDQLAEVMASGHRIEIRGFGSFHPRCFPKNRIRNPGNGRILSQTGYKRVLFRAAKALKQRVNRQQSE